MLRAGDIIGIALIAPIFLWLIARAIARTYLPERKRYVVDEGCGAEADLACGGGGGFKRPGTDTRTQLNGSHNHPGTAL